MADRAGNHSALMVGTDELEGETNWKGRRGGAGLAPPRLRLD
jgi:hypothetical protein